MFRKTVAGAVRVVTKAINDLEVVADREAKKSEKKKVKAILLEDAAAVHMDESVKATKLAANFRKLVEV